MSDTSEALLQINSCCQAFPKPDGEDLLVLNDINLTLKEGEIDVVENEQFLAVRLGKRLGASFDLQQCVAHDLLTQAGIFVRHTNRAAARMPG